jgi:hypothetical protein
LKITFTPKVAYRMIDRAKRTFARYPSRTVSNDWKLLLKQLQVFIVINPKLKVTAGTACFVRVREARNLFAIPKTFPPVMVDGVAGYMIVEINPKIVVLDSPQEVYDTVSHELAHCLDYKIRGWYGREASSFHDEFWSFLHKRMGGNGKAYIDESEFKFNFQLRRAKSKADKITQSFDSLDIVHK